MASNREPYSTGKCLMDEMRFIPSENSKGVHSILTSNRVITFFRGDKERAADLDDSLQYQDMRDCVTAKFGHREDLDHEKYHHSLDDFEIDHSHIVKGRDEAIEALTVNEFECLIDKIKAYEKEKGICKDGLNDCILSNEDQQKVIAKYREYYENQKKLPSVFFEKQPSLFKKISVGYVSFLGTFVYSTYSVLLDKYFHPYLINKGVDRKLVPFIIQTMKGILLLPLANPFNLTMEGLLKAGLNLLLNSSLINDDIKLHISTLIHGITTIKHVANSPYFLPKLFGSVSGVTAGTFFAYAFIRLLPKLKEEPSESRQHQAQHQNRQAVSDGLRFRGKI